MTLALDLSWRGIDVVVAERRPANAEPSVKCGQISARSMEVFRRLGLADKLRGVGLPADYPNDIVSATSVLGTELSRVSIPARGARGTAGATGPDTLWPTPEHTHRVNQKFFEPVLFAHVAAQPRVRILNRTEVDKFTQHDRGVSAIVRNLDSGRADVDRLLVPGGLRRRQFDGAQGDRCRVCGHAGAAACPVELHPRTGTAEIAAGETGMAVFFAQPPALRSDDGRRRPRDLECPELFLSR